MSHPQTCPECGAARKDGEACEDFFHQMLFWESEHPAYGAQVHHLMLLCYHLQHASLYSPEGLEYARQLLEEFLEHGTSPDQIRRRNRNSVASNRRTWKIKGTGEEHGSYSHRVYWLMTAADVVAWGVEHYCDSVRLWARSISDSLAAE